MEVVVDEKKNVGKHPDMMGPWRVGRSIGRDRGFRLRIVQNVETKAYAAVRIVPRSRPLEDVPEADTRRSKIKGNHASSPVGPLDAHEAPETPVLTDDMMRDLEREIVMMKITAHNNILALYDVWESKREIFIVTEYAGGGDLFTHFSDLSPNDMDEFTIAEYTHQILAALAHCHSLGATFNGIQAENILLDKSRERVKLALSDSTRLEPSTTRLAFGTRKDIWSCALILYRLLLRDFMNDVECEPWARFKGTSSSTEQQAMPPPFPVSVSEWACDLFDAMFLARNQSVKFIPASELLSYPFFTGIPDPQLCHTERRAFTLHLTAKTINYSVYKELLIAFADRSSEDSLRRRLLRNENSKVKEIYAILEEHRTHATSIVGVFRKSSDLAPMNPRLEPALRSQYLAVPSPVPAQTTGDSGTSASPSAHNSTRYWPFSPQFIFRRSPTVHSSPFSPSDESPELTDGGGLVEVQNNGLSTEDTTLGTSTLMGLFRKRSSRLHAHSTRGENRAQAVKPTLEDTIRCKLGKNSPVTQDYEMHATLDAHGGIPQHDAQGFEHHLEHFRAKNGDYSAAQRSKARQGGNKENEFQFITSQQGEHTAQNEDCDRQQPNSQPPYAHPYGKVKLEEDVQDATTRFEAHIKIEPPSNDDLYAEALVHDLYGSQPEEKVEAEYDYEDIAGLPPTIEDDSVQPHPRVHEKRPRRRLSKIRRDRAFQHEAPPEHPRASRLGSSPLGEQKWLGVIMSSILPNSSTADSSLLSVKGVSETKDECVRLLDEMQIVVDPSSLQGSDGLECELVENPYAAGAMDTPRYVRFRINFQPISPSASSSSSSAHARAGFVSLLTLVKQKGSSTSLKLVYNRLRRDWVLDDLSLTVSKLKGSALHRYDDGNNAADEPERHALTEIKLIPKRSPVIDAFAISPAMPPAISRTPARPRASH